MAEENNIITMYGKNVVGGDGKDEFGVINTNFKTIYNDLFRFRKVFRDESAGISDQLFYKLDQPGHYYFKLFFYFNNPYSDPTNPLSSNLLGINYAKDDIEDKNKYIFNNSALNYLYNNLEYTRFNHLSQFIQLLSDVSTKSPWYFQQISGLDTAIERNELSNRDFKIDEERKTITIKCLPDAYDNRIGRLLDLYRSVVYSQSLHKWILPANLRKFDMGIYIFNSPIKTISGGRFGISGDSSERRLSETFKEYSGNSNDDANPTFTMRIKEGNEIIEETSSWRRYKKYKDNTLVGHTNNMYFEPADFDKDNSPISSKYVELRGCEIDYNSSKSVYSELDNAEGKPMEYEIVIHFDSAMEDRYDPIFCSSIGDFVLEDLLHDENNKAEIELREESPNFYTTYYIDKTEKLIDGVNDSFSTVSQHYVEIPEREKVRKSFLESAATIASNYVGDYLDRIVMGNLYGFSFGKLESIVTDDPMNMLNRAGKEAHNASLIYKRITDFTKPDKGMKALDGKNLYDSDLDLPRNKFRTRAIEWVGNQILGKSQDNNSSRVVNNPSSTVGQSLYDDSVPETPKESLEGKNFYKGWAVEER